MKLRWPWVRRTTMEREVDFVRFREQGYTRCYKEALYRLMAKCQKVHWKHDRYWRNLLPKQRRAWRKAAKQAGEGGPPFWINFRVELCVRDNCESLKITIPQPDVLAGPSQEARAALQARLYAAFRDAIAKALDYEQ